MLVLEIAGGIILAVLILGLLPLIGELFVLAVVFVVTAPGRFLDFLESQSRWVLYPALTVIVITLWIAGSGLLH